MNIVDEAGKSGVRFITDINAINKEDYEAVYQCQESAPVAVKINGKWGFVGAPSTFIYKTIRLHYGALVGVKEDGTLDFYGRFFSH